MRMQTTGKFGNRVVTVAAATLLMLAGPAVAQNFERGTSTLGLMLGRGQQLQQDYTLVSGRAGYYFMREVEASVAIESWLGNTPKIYKAIPELRYVYSAPRTIKPYVATFVSRSFYEGSAVPDVNSWGAKAGAYYPLSRAAFLAFGLVHERVGNCDPRVYGECRPTFLELALHFVF